MNTTSFPPFKPSWFYKSPHVQTLLPNFVRKRPKLSLQAITLNTPDNDILELYHHAHPDSRGHILLLHGLEGTLRSHYAASTMHSLYQAGFSSTFLYFRGCSGTPNKLPRSYHSGDTTDLQFVIDHFTNIGNPINGAIGFSLGGNVLLKWLGTDQANTPALNAAVAVSVPYQLGDAADRLNQGISKLYRDHLINCMQAAYKRKFKQMKNPLKVDINKLKTFREFDNMVTSPLHGFSGVDEYYRLSSSRQYLKNIGTNTLLIHSKDDPFMYPGTIPTAEELSGNIQQLTTDHGGHVGFIESGFFNMNSWLDKAVQQWFTEHLSN